MTAEATAIAPSVQTVEHMSTDATLQTVEPRTRAIAPVDQRAERFGMYALTAYMLPRLYWHARLRGRA